MTACKAGCALAASLGTEMHARVEVAGFEGRYAVSEDGRVWAYPNVSRGAGRWLKQQMSETGYFYVCLFKDGTRRYVKVHRLVALAFLAPPQGGANQINHRDGVKTNNCASNLEWVTAAENVRHALREKLTVPKLRVMVTLRGQTKPLRHWCSEFGIPVTRATDRIFRLGWEPELAMTAPRFHRPGGKTCTAT